MDDIARNSPRYALQLASESTKLPKNSHLGPRAGWMVPEFTADHFREVLMRPYRIIYEIRGEACYIVAIIHGSRDLPRHIWPSNTIE